MKKVLIIGPGGAGKSTLARRLSVITGLPVFHLDALYWQPGWREPSKAHWQRVVGDILQKPSWILDGNFGGTVDMRISVCDTIILLEPPPLVCLWRALKRRIQYRGKTRPDMAADCPERLSWEFVWWVLTWRSHRLPALLGRLGAAADQGKVVVVLRTNAEVSSYLNSQTITSR
jgi:adenylate kinase family enzyme